MGWHGTAGDGEMTRGVEGTARAFQRWFDERSATWPGHLYGLGFRAMLALQSTKAPVVPEAIERDNRRDLANFTAAYAAHVASTSGSEKPSQDDTP